MLEIEKIPRHVLEYAYNKGVDLENIYLRVRQRLYLRTLSEFVTERRSYEAFSWN